MDPTTTCCPNWAYPARGQTGQDNLDIHAWQRNLTGSEMRRVVRALAMAHTVTWDYAPARMDLIRQWEQRGAKKGDAVITAHLEAATIRYLVSENRDFLIELPALPFTVLSSEEAVRLLEESGS